MGPPGCHYTYPQGVLNWLPVSPATVYPKKYAHGFVVLCFVVVTQSFITNSHEVFIHIHQGCFAGTGAIVRLPQCQWSKPDGYGKISQGITTTKHSKAKTVYIFLGIHCSIAPMAQHQPLHWANIGTPALGQHGFVSCANVEPTLAQLCILMLGQRCANDCMSLLCQHWPNGQIHVGPTLVYQCWPNVCVPTLAQR